MSERWKYQLKNGGGWGILTAIIMGGIDTYEEGFAEGFLNIGFVIQLAALLVIGTFGFGYILWREELGRRKSKASR